MPVVDTCFVFTMIEVVSVYAAYPSVYVLVIARVLVISVYPLAHILILVLVIARFFKNQFSFELKKVLNSKLVILI